MNINEQSVSRNLKVFFPIVMHMNQGASGSDGILAFSGILLIGLSLSKSHTSETALHTCVYVRMCLFACLLACRPYTVNLNGAY